VLANVDDNTIDPFEVGAAGGDVFDLRALTYAPLVQSGWSISSTSAMCG